MNPGTPKSESVELEELSRQDLIDRIGLLENALARQAFKESGGDVGAMPEEPSPPIFELIYESMTDGVVGFDELGRIVFVNPGMAMMVGYSIESLIGKTAQQAWSEEIKEPVPRNQATTFELDIARRDGSTRHVTKKIFGLTTNPPLDVAIYRDFTRQKRAEKDVRRQKDFFRSMVENAHDLVLVIGETGLLTYVSPAVLSLLGYSHEELIGKTVIEFMTGEGQEAFLEAQAEALREPRRAFPIREARLRSFHGRPRRFAGTIRNLLVEPSVQGLVVNLADITRQRETEETLKHEHALLQGILATEIAAVVVLDEMGRLSFANRAAEEILEIHSGHLYGQPCTDLNLDFYDETGARREPVDQLFRRLREEGQPLRNARRSLRLADGRVKNLSLCGELLQLSTTETSGAVFLIRDVTRESQTESRLNLSERVLHSVENGIVVVDARTHGRPVTFVNSAFEDLTGVSPEFLQNRPTDALRGELPQTEALHAIFTALNRRERGRTLVETESREGRPLWIEVYTAPVQENGTNPTHLVGILNDVTPRQQAVMALRESETLLASVVDTTPLGLSLTDDEMNYVLVNRAFCDMFGYRQEDLLGRKFSFILPESQRAEAERIHQAFLRGEPEPVSEWRVLRSDGTPMDVQATVGRLTGQDGRPRKITLVEDITERKNEERRREEKEGFLKSIYDGVEAGIYVVDVRAGGDFVYTGMNPVLEQALGIPVDELSGMLLDELEDYLPDETVNRWQEKYNECLRAGEPLLFEETIELKGRQTKWITRLAPLKDNEGRIYRLVAILHQVTETRLAEQRQRDLEDKIASAQKLESLGVLAGGIAHDFNNLLVGILGNSSLALEEADEDTPLLSCLKQIDSTATRMSELTNQLLAYSGRAPFEIRPLDLNQHVEETVGLAQLSISKKTELSFFLTEDAPFVKADVTQLRQVLLNLVTNASESLGDMPGDVKVSTDVVGLEEADFQGVPWSEDLEPGVYARLRISDTGCGMDKETRERIFDPFFTTKFSGRGLGLASVMGIVRSHKGFIHVESEPGRGTRISVYLPACAPPGSSGEVEMLADSSEWSTKGRVLIVDDEEMVRSVLRRIVERAGFEVEESGNGLDALRRIKEDPDGFSGILLDLTMPRLDGEEAMKQIRLIRPDMPVILMSGFSRSEITERFSKCRISGFLSKPFRASDVQDLLMEVFG